MTRPTWAVVGQVVLPSRKLRIRDDLGIMVRGVVLRVDPDKIFIHVWKWKKSKPIGYQHITTYFLRFADILDTDSPSHWHPDEWQPATEPTPEHKIDQLRLPGVDCPP
jgi:hypothetical protein